MTRSIGLLSYKGVRIVFGMLLTCCFLSTFPPICRVMAHCLGGQERQLFQRELKSILHWRRSSLKTNLFKVCIKTTNCFLFCSFVCLFIFKSVNKKNTVLFCFCFFYLMHFFFGMIIFVYFCLFFFNVLFCLFCFVVVCFWVCLFGGVVVLGRVFLL